MPDHTAPAGDRPGDGRPRYGSTFDPARDAMLTPSRLRGLVHPLRVRLLNLLERDGPATASQLARRIGESSGATSYHLRVLAEHGFIAEDSERGNARDRWWVALHRSTNFTFRDPDDPGTPETVELAGHFIRMVADTHHEKALRYVDSLVTDREHLAESPWQFADIPMRLTLAQARELSETVVALIDRYRREAGDPDPEPDTVRAVFQFQLLPDPGPEEDQ
jgi:DNA-binding transcriptional ArsR family regulator